MQNIIQGLRRLGATDTTVQAVIIILVIFLALIGLAALGVDIYAVVRGEQPVGWASLIVGGIAIFFTTIVSSAHTASTIDGSNAKMAASITQATQPNVEQQAQTVQMAIQALAALHTQQSSTVSQQVSASQQATQAIQENTAATKENTEQEKQHGS